MTIKYEFTLSKDVLVECYDESLPHSPHQSPKYAFAGGFIGLLGLLIFTEIGGVAPYIMIGLGVLEFIEFLLSQALVVSSSMWSRASNSVVTITLDDNGIASVNPYTKST